MHGVFKGTPTRSPDDVNREFDEMGANHNAFTSEEHTVYYASVLPEYQTDALRLLGDMMRPALREEDFNTEKQVIIEEIRMYEDQPPFGADDKIKVAFFGRHPLARSVLGTVDSITELKVDAMRGYFDRRYSPGNIALVATGRVDFDAAGGHHRRSLRRLAAVSHRARTARRQRRSRPALFAQTVGDARIRAATFFRPGRRRSAPPCRQGFVHRAGRRFRQPALLGTGRQRFGGAGLAQPLRLPGRGPVHDLHDLRGGSGHGQSGAHHEHLSRAETTGITPAELAQAKSKIKSRVVLSSERPRGRLFNVGGNWLQRHAYRTIEEDLRSFDAVTIDDVAGLLAEFPLSRAMVMAVGPLTAL